MCLSGSLCVNFSVALDITFLWMRAFWYSVCHNNNLPLSAWWLNYELCKEDWRPCNFKAYMYSTYTIVHRLCFTIVIGYSALLEVLLLKSCAFIRIIIIIMTISRLFNSMRIIKHACHGSHYSTCRYWCVVFIWLSIKPLSCFCAS